MARECDEGNFDYLFFEALYNELYEGPDSYGGFSGGALWQLLVRPDGSTFEIADTLLSGVAFYQSGKQNDGVSRTKKPLQSADR
jgi:hypothetical protein